MTTPTYMAPSAAVARLAELTATVEPTEVSDDGWDCHVEADDILCAVLRYLGHVDVAEAFGRAAGSWWYA